MGRLRDGFKGSFYILVLIGLFLVGCSSADDVVQEVRETPVAVAEVITGSLSGSNQITGEATAGTDLMIVPKMAGELKEIFVKKGDQVVKGQELARIDDRDQRRALQNDQSMLTQAQNGLDRARNGLNQAEGSYQQALSSKRQAETNRKEAKQNQQHQISNLKIELANAKSQWDAAKKNLERMEALLADGLISQVEYEEAVNAESRAARAHEQIELNLAQASNEISLVALDSAVEQAEIGVRMAQATLKDAEIAVKDASIAVEQAKLGVEASEDRLQDYVIVAPASGEIATLDADVGELVSGQTPFARLITVDIIHATAHISAEQLLLFEIDDQVEVVFAGLPEPKQGRVSFISPIINDSGLFTVEVEVNNEVRDIRPGMVATIQVEEVLVEDRMIVPTAAVVERQDEAYVFIIENNTAVRKDIEVIRYDTEFTAVSGEIYEGEKIVIKGQNLLNDGDLVRIIEEAK